MDFTQPCKDMALYLVNRYGRDQAIKIVTAQNSWVNICYAFEPECISLERKFYISEVAHEVFKITTEAVK